MGPFSDPQYTHSGISHWSRPPPHLELVLALTLGITRVKCLCHAQHEEVTHILAITLDRRGYLDTKMLVLVMRNACVSDLDQCKIPP